MIILRKGEDKQGYRVLMVKLTPHSETRFSVQKKVKFLWFFTKWEDVLDKYGMPKIFDSNKNATAFINFQKRW
jgi:hypothetical protein